MWRSRRLREMSWWGSFRLLLPYSSTGTVAQQLCVEKEPTSAPIPRTPRFDNNWQKICNGYNLQMVILKYPRYVLNVVLSYAEDSLICGADEGSELKQAARHPRILDGCQLFVFVSPVACHRCGLVDQFLLLMWFLVQFCLYQWCRWDLTQRVYEDLYTKHISTVTHKNVNKINTNNWQWWDYVHVSNYMIFLQVSCKTVQIMVLFFAN